MATEIHNAKQFTNHRELVEAITVLKDSGEIDGYSIHRHPIGGYAAGVRKDETWGYLA